MMKFSREGRNAAFSHGCLLILRCKRTAVTGGLRPYDTRIVVSPLALKQPDAQSVMWKLAMNAV